MDHSPTPYREVALPVSVLRALRRGLSRDNGPLSTIHALHAAGHEGGTAAAAAFRRTPDEQVRSLPEDAFWTRLSAFLADRGWGSLAHVPVHEGIGILYSENWAESAVNDTPDSDASCSFTTGFLSGLLTELAGGPVAVVEVDCRARGDARCAFAFGSEAAVHELYGLLLESSDLDSALARL